MTKSEEEESVCRTVGDRRGLLECYVNRAVLAQKMGNVVQMREYARKAVSIADELNVQVQPLLRLAADM